MQHKMEDPGALAGATGADCKAANFTVTACHSQALVATAPIALRIAYLIHRANVDPGAAVTLAGLIWEGAA